MGISYPRVSAPLSPALFRISCKDTSGNERTSCPATPPESVTRVPYQSQSATAGSFFSRVLPPSPPARAFPPARFFHRQDRRGPAPSRGGDRVLGGNLSLLREMEAPSRSPTRTRRPSTPPPVGHLYRVCSSVYVARHASVSKMGINARGVVTRSPIATELRGRRAAAWIRYSRRW